MKKRKTALIVCSIEFIVFLIIVFSFKLDRVWIGGALFVTLAIMRATWTELNDSD